MFEFYEKWVNVAAGIGENRWKENDTRERAFAPRGRSFFVLNTPNIDVHVHANMCARVCVWHISSSVKKRVVCRTIVLSSRRNCTSIMHYRAQHVERRNFEKIGKNPQILPNLLLYRCSNKSDQIYRLDVYLSFWRVSDLMSWIKKIYNLFLVIFANFY